MWFTQQEEAVGQTYMEQRQGPVAAVVWVELVVLELQLLLPARPTQGLEGVEVALMEDPMEQEPQAATGSW